MSWVRKHRLPQRPASVNGLTQEQKLAIEESNVQKSLAYARKRLVGG
jgi:hypothetical protein